MFKFLKEKLKKSISLFSKKIDETGEEEIIEEERTVEEKEAVEEEKAEEEKEAVEEIAKEEQPEEKPKKEGFFKRLFKRKEEGLEEKEEEKGEVEKEEEIVEKEEKEEEVKEAPKEEAVEEEKAEEEKEEKAEKKEKIIEKKEEVEEITEKETTKTEVAAAEEKKPEEVTKEVQLEEGKKAEELKKKELEKKRAEKEIQRIEKEKEKNKERERKREEKRKKQELKQQELERKKEEKERQRLEKAKSKEEQEKLRLVEKASEEEKIIEKVHIIKEKPEPKVETIEKEVSEEVLSEKEDKKEISPQVAAPKQVAAKELPTQEEKIEEKKVATEEEKEEEIIEKKTEEPKKGFFSKLKEKVVTKKINSDKFDALFWDLEVVLLENNIAVEVIEKIKEDLRQDLVDKPIRRNKIEQTIMVALKKSIEDVLSSDSIDMLEKMKNKKPYVICFVGVNGSGKTTTIAKVAKMLLDNNKKVVLAAADTFRAAAIDQLQIHADNLGIKMIKQDYGSDPAAVAFDAIKYAQARDTDAVLIDTAGRLHSNVNLMDEMKKIIRVSKPDLKIFVGEAITGNDCIEQAIKFNEAIDIDGIILAKADIDEKGGASISISYVTKKPILYLGMGQEYTDIKPFDKNEIIESLGLVA